MNYTTSADVFAYGDVEAPTANQTAVMNDIITAVSRRVDKICKMNFSQTSFTNYIVPSRVTLDGILTLYINSPSIATVTAVSVRSGNLPSTLPVNIANAVIEANYYGSKILFYGLDYWNLRDTFSRRAYATYTGGWANLAAVPEDFQLATTRLAWFTYQQRAAPMNSTAVPELGIITLPASIQPDILDVYKRYTWWYA